MKKLLTFLFALMMMSTFTFGQGNLFYWTGAFDAATWTNAGNWTAPAPLPYGEPGGASTWPGQAATGDYAVFNNSLVNLVTLNQNITLGRFEVTFLPSNAPTLLWISGPDMTTITMRTPSAQLIAENTYWVFKIDEGCLLDLNTPQQRINIVCQPRANFWHKDLSTFNPADYSNNSTVCNAIGGQVLKGFVLQSDAVQHAEFIQQQWTAGNAQAVKGWIEYTFDDNNYHFFSPPIVSENWGAVLEFAPPNQLCRKPNSLCIFDGEYIRDFTNGGAWNNWLGIMGTCWNPAADIPFPGKGYEIYGNPNNNKSQYEVYGTFNTQWMAYNPANPAASFVLLPVTAGGWNFIGNPFPSAIKFDEASGAPTAGTGWSWYRNFTDPVVYYWDNVAGQYITYNWHNGLPNGNLRFIPRSQGFFVHVSQFLPAGPAAGSDIMIGNEARVFRGNLNIAKSAPSNTLNITLRNGEGNSIDQGTISFREDAIGSDFDNQNDAYKIYNDITNPSQIYFKTTDNVDAAIKVLQLVSGNIMYPVYMKVLNTGSYTLDFTEISSFSPNTSIMLKDTKTNTTVDLKENPVYSFTATEGEDDARFNLYFSNVLYGLNNLDANSFKVYSYDKAIFIQNNDMKNVSGTVFVYDMIGKQMMQENLNSNAVTRINTNFNAGFYIVSIKTENGVYNQKVYVK